MRLRTLTALVVAAALTVAAAPASAEESPPVVEYRPPVEGPVVEPFRAPEHDYAAGNRGVDFSAAAGEEVRAVADGEVVFAGQVGGALHVVVRHADGLRSSLSFVADITVRRGQDVRAGDVIAVAGGPVHFGLRAGERYLDPMPFLRGGEPEVHLAPLRPEDFDEGDERAALAKLLRVIGRTGLSAARAGVAWARRSALPPLLGDHDTLRAWLSVSQTLAMPEALRLAMAARAWHERRDECTPPTTSPPPRPGRRLLVLVGGLGSAGPDGASVFHFDHRGAGYDDADVVRFSYLGGDARDRPYTPADTQQSIAASAGRLAATIRQLAAAHPDVPIDVVAHSQGGLVSRAALVIPAEPLPVATFVTLGTPHGGASLATAGTLFRSTNVGDAVLDAAGRLDLGVDPQSTSVRQLSEGSDFVSWLGDRPLPQRTKVVSVAARTDVVVPSPDCRLTGATNIVVTVGGALGAFGAHDALPRSAAATREVALAVAGLPSTCESLADALTDVLVGDGIEVGEDAVAAALGVVP